MAISLGEAEAWQCLRRVKDPEIPVLSVVELGLIREVRKDCEALFVAFSPTYVGCPATETIRADMIMALRVAGFTDVRVEICLSPVWTTDWITAEGREKLKEVGIAPPAAHGCDQRALLGGAKVIACPKCGSQDTRLVAPFGSTPCKAQFCCDNCLEPFDYFKCL